MLILWCCLKLLLTALDLLDSIEWENEQTNEWTEHVNLIRANPYVDVDNYEILYSQ